MISRRRMLTGLSALIAAPAVIRVADLMTIKPVRAAPEPDWIRAPDVYLASEQIFVGDVLTIGRDGKVSRASIYPNVDAGCVKMVGVCEFVRRHDGKDYAQVSQLGHVYIVPTIEPATVTIHF